ncbi:(2R)-phospho-3-sulfolactate synthase ComA protein [Dioscorea alata]|uniref:(2R)-phospho-3-sulfolactate synthase ComA protein n=1 Tax=Dioscorea alata TaxID=55571 RepID=A0ACB7VEP1_DIOAL|nr:(2R)-phospho-3-sulfolactate synthase ComA protein [Dioscorea alata]
MALYYGWKSFSEEEDRPEKPRRFGVTEMRSPNYSLMSNQPLEYYGMLLWNLRGIMVLLSLDSFIVLV